LTDLKYLRNSKRRTVRTISLKSIDRSNFLKPPVTLKRTEIGEKSTKSIDLQDINLILPFCRSLSKRFEIVGEINTFETANKYYDLVSTVSED